MIETIAKDKVEEFANPNYSYGVGRVFPKDWTDEQVIKWNNDNCDCQFHRERRGKDY